jgi:hypothetical protein
MSDGVAKGVVVRLASEPEDGGVRMVVSAVAGDTLYNHRKGGVEPVRLAAGDVAVAWMGPDGGVRLATLPAAALRVVPEAAAPAPAAPLFAVLGKLPPGTLVRTLAGGEVERVAAVQGMPNYVQMETPGGEPLMHASAGRFVEVVGAAKADVPAALAAVEAAKERVEQASRDGVKLAADLLGRVQAEIPLGRRRARAEAEVPFPTGRRARLGDLPLGSAVRGNPGDPASTVGGYDSLKGVKLTAPDGGVSWESTDTVVEVVHEATREAAPARDKTAVGPDAAGLVRIGDLDAGAVVRTRPGGGVYKVRGYDSLRGVEVHVPDRGTLWMDPETRVEVIGAGAWPAEPSPLPAGAVRARDLEPGAWFRCSPGAETVFEVVGPLDLPAVVAVKNLAENRQTRVGADAVVYPEPAGGPAGETKSGSGEPTAGPRAVRAGDLKPGDWFRESPEKETVFRVIGPASDRGPGVLELVNLRHNVRACIGEGAMVYPVPKDVTAGAETTRLFALEDVPVGTRVRTSRGGPVYRVAESPEPGRMTRLRAEESGGLDAYTTRTDWVEVVPE